MSETNRRVFTAEHVVRGYELDGNVHVNHATYVNYGEWARWCMMQEVEGGADYFARNGVNPVVVRLEIDYRAECLLGEKLRIETSLLEFRRRTATFKHKIIKPNGKLAADLRVTLVGVDKSGRAVSLPEDFEKLFG